MLTTTPAWEPRVGSGSTPEWKAPETAFWVSAGLGFSKPSESWEVGSNPSTKVPPEPMRLFSQRMQAFLMECEMWLCEFLGIFLPNKTLSDGCCYTQEPLSWLFLH